MNCQSCNKERVLSIRVKHSDLGMFRLNEVEHSGYAPFIEDVCGGDYTTLRLCLDCGQVQGAFPKEAPRELEPNNCSCDDDDRVSLFCDEVRRRYCAFCGEWTSV